MNFRAFEKSMWVLEKSWNSPGNLFLEKGTNPDNNPRWKPVEPDRLSRISIPLVNVGKCRIKKMTHFQHCKSGKGIKLLGVAAFLSGIEVPVPLLLACTIRCSFASSWMTSVRNTFVGGHSSFSHLPLFALIINWKARCY